MKLIFGLGNPGKKYVFTRHNIGCRLIDEIARGAGVHLKRDTKCLSFSGHAKYNNKLFALAKPLIFMNENGESLKLVCEKFSVLKGSAGFENLLVVFDDIDLPLGVIRYRAKGSAGTHRGMKSCIEFLGTSDFPRLRIGIRGDRLGKDLSQYVLENFTEQEESVLKDVLGQAREKILTEFL